MAYLKNIKFVMAEGGKKKEMGRGKTTGPSYPVRNWSLCRSHREMGFFKQTNDI